MRRKRHANTTADDVSPTHSGHLGTAGSGPAAHKDDHRSRAIQSSGKVPEGPQRGQECSPARLVAWQQRHRNPVHVRKAMDR